MTAGWGAGRDVASGGDLEATATLRPWPRPLLWLLAIVLGGAMGGLGYWILRTAVADQLAISAPLRALAIDPGNPRALIAAAELDLKARPVRLASAQARLRAAVRSEPLNARIYSDLAVAALLSGDEARANLLFSLALQRSRREAGPDLWAFGQAARAHDYAGAWKALDIILRTQRGDVSAIILPAVIQLLADPRARPPLVSLLAADPPWRTSFLQALMRLPFGPDAVAALLSQLASSAHPPTDEETGPLLNVLIAAGAYPRAFSTWVQMLPPNRLAALADVYNGRFMTGFGDTPFNWTVTPDAQGVAALGAGDDGKGLRVIPIDRPGALPFLRELLVLPEGAYGLSGSVRTPGLITARDQGWRWRLRCAQDNRILGESEPLATADQATRFRVALTVPSACTGQWLSLERSSEPSTSADDPPTLFDNLVIARTDPPAP
jgi:hypothetical protein